MNIPELEKLATEANAFGTESMRVVGSIPADTIITMIELMREMADVLEWQQGGDLRKAALMKYKGMMK